MPGPGGGREVEEENMGTTRRREGSSARERHSRKKKLVRTRRVSKAESSSEDEVVSTAENDLNSHQRKKQIQQIHTEDHENKRLEKNCVKFAASSLSNSARKRNESSKHSRKYEDVSLSQHNGSLLSATTGGRNTLKNGSDVSSGTAKKSHEVAATDLKSLNSTPAAQSAASKPIKTILKSIPWRKVVGNQEAGPVDMGDSAAYQHHHDLAHQSTSSTLKESKAKAPNHVAAKPSSTTPSTRWQQQPEGPSCNHIPVHPGNGNATGIGSGVKDVGRQQTGVIGLEPSSWNSPRDVEKSSLLVDMGKVVGVLRTQAPLTQPEEDEEEEEQVEHQLLKKEEPERSGCSTCAKELGDAIDDSLCGDPLMYATFVAPIQQYSTETESSRQPSFNVSSRQPSTEQQQQKHNNLQASDSSSQLKSLKLLPSVPFPNKHALEPNYSNDVQDIYEEVPVDPWPSAQFLPSADNLATSAGASDCIEISQAELNQQVVQERLSFLSVSSNNEEEDDEEEESVTFPPLPPLPPTPPPSQRLPEPSCLWDSGDEEGEVSEKMPSNAATRNNGNGRRKVKRDRNRSSIDRDGNVVALHSSNKAAFKSRSKSCSPGREMETATVVILQPKPPRTRRDPKERGETPDNVSESSVSFHENELKQEQHNKSVQICDSGKINLEAHRPQSAGVDGSFNSRQMFVPRVCERPREGDVPFMSKFANRNSVRESWISSGGSDYHGSVASGGGEGSFYLPHLATGGAPTGSLIHVEECSVPTSDPYGPYRPHSKLRSISQINRRSSSSSYGKGSGNYSLRNVRSSSRESESSWSARGGGGFFKDPRPCHFGGFDEAGQRCEVGSHPDMPCLSAAQTSSLNVGVPDCVQLEDQDYHSLEDDMVLNLQTRFRKDHIYTYIGNILLSVNPYKKLHLYHPEVINVYRCHCLYELPPHIYAVTDRAWRNMREMNCDQSVLISGEAGSGKTEAFKLSLQYLVAVTSHTKPCHTLKYQILQTNPIFEAFGNAKTCNNDNSSRYAKQMEVFFDFKGDPVGCLLTNFFLEKSRVTKYSIGERNFHIFYQMLLGGDPALLKEFHLHRNPENYQILRLSRVYEDDFTSSSTAPSSSSSATSTLPPLMNTNENIDDRKDFCNTRRAMMDVGLSSDEIYNVFGILASILKLGNVDFVPSTNMDGTEGCAVVNDYELYEICNVLHGDFEAFQSCLLTRTIESRNEVVVADLCSEEAARSRDSLCKTLYSRLFTWLTNRLNESLKLLTPRKAKVISFVDMFGFESVISNGFEQLVINFANEKIQQILNNWLLNVEQEEYAKEGIEWRRIQFFDNSVICSLIEKSPCGILSTLDDVTLRKPGGTSNSGSFLFSNSVYYGTSSSISEHSMESAEVLLEKLSKECGSHPHFACNNQQSSVGEEILTRSSSRQMSKYEFKIKHFAGTVTYDAQDFVDRNFDIFHQDLSRTMFECDNHLLKQLCPEGNPRRTARKRPATAGTQFKISMNSLLTSLSVKTPHYVRCIKPNEQKQPKKFDLPLVKHQISCQNLVHVLLLRKNGFVLRMPYDSFLHRYKMLSPHTWPHWKGPSVEGVTYLLREISISANEYAFGRTKIFIRSNKTAELLEEFRRAKIDDLAIIIQKTFRGYVGRKRWVKLRDSQVIISTFWKKWKDKSHIVDLKQRRKEEWAAIVIQKWFRCWQQRQFLLDLAFNLPNPSPLSKDWPRTHRHMRDSSALIRRIFHKWRCHGYRRQFDQIARNRMREKVTASIIFKDRKESYPRSIAHPFLGDYVRLRQNPQWKKLCSESNDQYVVFADIINKITRSSGKFVPILFVVSTSSMLIMDQRTMQIKYRIPASEILKISLSPFKDDIAVFHVKMSSSPSREIVKSHANIPGCLSSEPIRKKGDFVLQTGHVIEIVTKLFLVVQNATGKPPFINICTEIEANFGGESNSMFTFKPTTSSASVGSGAGAGGGGGYVKLVKRGNKFEVLV